MFEIFRPSARKGFTTTSFQTLKRRSDATLLFSHFSIFRKVPYLNTFPVIF